MTGSRAEAGMRFDAHTAGLAHALTDLARGVSAGEDDELLPRLLDLATSEWVGARWASVSTLRQGKYATLAYSHELMRDVEQLQFDAGKGPSVDAAATGPTRVYTGDTLAEQRWGDVGRRLNDEMGVKSLLAFRLPLRQNELVATLDLASDQPEAFEAQQVLRAQMLANQGALLVSVTFAEARCANLLRGLESNREIGVAVGVLMARYGISKDNAFEVLRIASQEHNRKLVDVALEVADTGLAPVALSHRRLHPP